MMRSASAIAVAALFCLLVGSSLSEEVVEQWRRGEFMQVPGGVCPDGEHWASDGSMCGGSVLYACLPTWSGVVDFVDATPQNCTLNNVVVRATGSFGCPSEDYTITATLNGEVVAETPIRVAEQSCGCAEGAEVVEVVNFNPAETLSFRPFDENVVVLSAVESFCVCLTGTVGTFTCDLEEEEHEKYVEQQTLESLYHMTNGPNWYNSRNWLEGTPCENAWFGVTCDDNGHVVSLALNNNNLDGVVPDMTGAAALDVLELMENRLFGSLPELPRSLSEVFLTDNNFQGGIPSSWANLKQLEFLNVATNFLTGSVEQELVSGLVEIVQFNVAHNFFNGTFPGDFSHNLRMLELTASHNMFTGDLPTVFPTLGTSDLQYLSMNDNLFSGGLPASWATDLPILTSVDLSTNRLTGPLPGEFASIQRLLMMDIRTNRMSGVLPDSFNSRPGLQVLASGNDWACPLPDWCTGGVSSCGLCDAGSPMSPSDSYSLSSSSGATTGSSLAESSTSAQSSGAVESSRYGETSESSGLYIETSTSVALETSFDKTSTNTTTSTEEVLPMDDIIVLIVTTVVFSLCGIGIVIGILVYLVKKKKSEEDSDSLVLPSFDDE